MHILTHFYILYHNNIIYLHIYMDKLRYNNNFEPQKCDFQPKNNLKLTLNMRKNAKLYLLSWALCFMWTKNYCLHKKLKFWMKGPDWKDQKSSSKYNPFMFSLRIIYTLCLMDKKGNRLREPTNRLILIIDESNWVHPKTSPYQHRKFRFGTKTVRW